MATSEDLLELLATRNVDAIVEGLNRIKQMTFAGQFHPVLEALWREDREAYPGVPWDVLAIPVVRLEIGSILIQAQTNGTPTEASSLIHQYALDQLGSRDSDTVSRAVFLVATFNESSDVAVVERVAADERFLRAGMIGLNSMCVSEADAAAERILASCAVSYCDELIGDRARMLEFKERAPWCAR